MNVRLSDKTADAALQQLLDSIEEREFCCESECDDLLQECEEECNQIEEECLQSIRTSVAASRLGMSVGRSLLDENLAEYAEEICEQIETTTLED